MHQPQRGGAFFMAPDKLHHVEALYSEACGLRAYFYNIRTEAIGVTSFRAFARVIPASPDEPEVLRFPTPVEEGALRGPGPGHEPMEGISWRRAVPSSKFTTNMGVR